MKKFIAKHPYISLQISSIVIALFLIAIFFISVPIFALKVDFLPGVAATIYWIKIAPIVEIVIVYIIAVFLYSKNFLKSLRAIFLSPIIWLSLYLLILVIFNPYNM